MNKPAGEMNISRMQRMIAATGVVLLLAAAIMATGLNAGSATAAWDSPSPGIKVAKKKSQITATETGVATATETVSSTTTSTVTSTVTRTQVPQATRTRTPQVEQTRTPRPTGTVSKVSICHRTGSQTNPYVQITISTSALSGHQQHGDIYPVPQGGCPQATPRVKRTPRATNTARPAATATSTITVQANRGNANGNANPGNNGNNGNANGNADPGNNGNGNGNDNGNANDKGDGGKKGKP